MSTIFIILLQLVKEDDVYRMNWFIKIITWKFSLYIPNLLSIHFLSMNGFHIYIFRVIRMFTKNDFLLLMIMYMKIIL